MTRLHTSRFAAHAAGITNTFEVIAVNTFANNSAPATFAIDMR